MVLAMLLAAIEGTIVATAMPSIAARLGGFALYGWVFSSYLLMQAVMTPIFGKLADLYGRKPVLIAGIGLFLVGSVLCGLATSMVMLVVFRFVQGIGAGAVMPITATLVGDLYSIEERGRVQGYMASVWGVSSIIGPLAGGLIVEHADWHWIFWLNVPFGLIAIALIGRYLHEHMAHRGRRIDYAGAALLLTGLIGLMLALTQGSVWGAGPAVGLAGAAIAILVFFVGQQGRAEDPIMHLELWRNPVIRIGNLTILAAGLAMIGLISYLPTFMQGVLGTSALVAGFTLSAMSIGWPIASVVAGRLFTRLGVRTLVRTGSGCAVTGALLIALFADYGPVLAGPGSFLLGVGLGLLNTTIIVAIQSSVAWPQRGVATATNLLMRNLGNAVGAAVLGGVLNLSLAAYLKRQGLTGRVSLDSVRSLVEEGASGPPLAPALADLLRAGLSGSLHLVFWGIFLCTAAMLLIGWRIPEPGANKPA